MKKQRKLIALIPTAGKTPEQMQQDIHKILKKKMPTIYKKTKIGKA